MNFIKNNRNKFLSLFGMLVIAGFIFIAGYVDKQTFIINDSSLADNDTIVSGWINIGSAENVALQTQVLDSVWARSEIFYRYGTTGQRIALAAADTIGVPNHTASATTSFGKSVGKVIRGYGLAADLIPGANYIYVKTTIVNDNTGDHGTGSSSENVKVSLISAD